MPEPNLPPLNLNSICLDDIEGSLPEMPDNTRGALARYDLPLQHIEILVVRILSIYDSSCKKNFDFDFLYFFLQKNATLLNLFLRVADNYTDPNIQKIASNLLKTDVIGACKQLKIKVQNWYEFLDRKV